MHEKLKHNQENQTSSAYDMNQAIALNSEFFYNLSVIAQNEGQLKRAIRYVKKLAKEKLAHNHLFSRC